MRVRVDDGLVVVLHIVLRDFAIIRQIYFVNQIVAYVVHNGLMKDLSVLQEPPFTDQGSIVEVFGTNLPLWSSIRKSIEQINMNALAA